jgi:hypothetical protein
MGAQVRANGVLLAMVHWLWLSRPPFISRSVYRDADTVLSCMFQRHFAFLTSHTGYHCVMFSILWSIITVLTGSNWKWTVLQVSKWAGEAIWIRMGLFETIHSTFNFATQIKTRFYELCFCSRKWVKVKGKSSLFYRAPKIILQII